MGAIGNAIGLGIINTLVLGIALMCFHYGLKRVGVIFNIRYGITLGVTFVVICLLSFVLSSGRAIGFFTNISLILGVPFWIVCFILGKMGIRKGGK